MTDASTTGRRKRSLCKQRVVLFQVEQAKTVPVRRGGPITRSMTRDQKE